MKKFSKFLAILLVVSIILPGMVNAAEEPTTLGLTRLSGFNRTLTSIAVSKEVYKEGSNVVVLAGYNGSADALTGALLTGLEDAPLLILARTGVTNELKGEIKRLKAKKAYILGGNVAVSKSTEADLKELGLEIERLDGKSRYETATKIAEKSKNTKNAFLALGRVEDNTALADAMVVGAVSAKENIPVFLTKKNEIPKETIKALKDLKVTDITIIGESKAIPNAIRRELEAMNIKVDRVGGNNRYETSTIVAKKYFENSKKLIIANGRVDFDALVGGYLGAKEDAPILLTRSNKLSDETKSYMKKHPKKSYVLGGDTVITKSVFKEIDIALNPHKEESSDNGDYYIDVKLTPEDAYDIFKKEYPNAKVKELELDSEDGSYVYEVEGIEKNKKYEIKINSSNGKIIKSKEENTNDKLSDEIKRKDLANIPILLKKAVEDVKKGYQLKEWSVEVDDGIVEFEIEFTNNENKIEYEYNLRTGKLIKVKENGASSNNGGDYADVKLTPEDAYDIFKKEYPNAKVKELELDNEDGSYVYEVEGIEKNKKYEIKINSSNGKIIKSKEENTNDKLSDEIKRKDLANIPILLKKAVEDVKKGYQLKEWSVEVDDGIIEFEIEFTNNGNKIEYEYNLRTGKLIKVKENGASSNNGGDYADVKLTPEDAYDIFKKEYPNAKVKELELDNEDGSYVYEVEGVEKNKKYEIKIDSSNGKIIKSKEENTNDKLNDEIKRKDLANIPILLKKATEDVKKGYQFKEWSVEVDDGIIEFEIEFTNNGNKIEYEYNLRTGKLIKVKEK